MIRNLSILILGLGLTLFARAQDDPQKPLRAGIIGLDTSHVTAFTGLLNNPKNNGDLAGVRVVAAYPGGSPDLPDSINRVEGFTKTLRDKYQVEIVDSIDVLLKKVDVVLLESVDGRPHLKQVIPVLKAGKLCFIDKPVAGSLADALEIYHLAKKYKVPVFSSSSLRFSPGILKMRNDPKVGEVLGCLAYGPCPIEKHHPDLFWYGIHGVETLFTIMGPGCKSVVRTNTKGADVVTGTWNDGRIGTFRGIRAGQSGYGAMVFGSKGVAPSGGYGGYEPLVVEICKFFRTGKPPVSAEETIEIFAFMEAADESKRQGGIPVTLENVIAKAKTKGNVEKTSIETQEQADDEKGFVPMFNGKDFSGWRFGNEPAKMDKLPKNWKVEGGMIKLLGGGSPHLASVKEYEDFDVRMQWRAHKKGYNSGFYIRSGKNVGANQINLAQSDCGHLMGGAKGGKAVPKLQKPPGEWNDWRVLAQGDKLTLWCNGTKAWEVSNFKPRKGYIGLQAEGHAIDFKNIRIKELPTSSARRSSSLNEKLESLQFMVEVERQKLTLLQSRQSQGKDGIVPEGAKLEKIFDGGVVLTEGVAIAPDNMVYFSDITFSHVAKDKKGVIEAGHIWKYNPKTGRTTIFRSPSGMSNGIKFDAEGNMIVAEGADYGGRRVIRTDMKTGKSYIIAAKFEGRPFNSPNDITIDEKGRIYFSDPRYLGHEPIDQPVQAVYRIDPDGSIHRIITDAGKPNGVCISPDQKTMYVVSNDNGTTGLDRLPKDTPVLKGRMALLAYDLSPEGTAKFRKVLVNYAPQDGPDGLVVDVEGNLYVAVRDETRPGIYVYSPSGKELAYIKTEIPTNVGFGRGLEGKTLYITAGKSLYRIRLNKEGYQLPSK